MVPAAEGRQEGQLIAGRYRLASLHRRDERTDVWRARDESLGHVVTLEFLRDREPASRERFLAEGRRMAAVGRPSVVRVAAIHDDGDATFVVYVDVNAAVDAPKPEAEMTLPVVNAPEPPKVEPPKAEPVAATPAAPILDMAAAAPEVPAPTVSSDSSTDEALTMLIGALRARDLSLVDVSVLKESAREIAADVRSLLEDLRLNELVAAARALLDRVDMSLLRSAFARATAIAAEARPLLDRADMSVLGSASARAAVTARGLASIRPRVHVPAPHVSRPPRVRPVREKPVVRATPATPRAPGRRVGVRLRRVVWRGLSLGLLAAVVISLPPELLGNIENEAGKIVSEVRSTIAQMSRAVAPSEPALARASFELPPLSAYGAAFESQGPYPTTSPDGTAEWVVALRNTGSVGWYRGIDGAQASLALADGTSAGVQSTTYVGPGQVGWFAVRFRAPSQAGTYKVSFLPRIDGRGPLPDLGIYATVTVSTNP